MKSFIKKILLEYVEGMDEANHTKHSLDRLDDRVLFPVDVPVRFNYHDGQRWSYETVGTYTLLDNLKSKIQEKVDLILKYDVPLDENYAVIIHHFNLYPSDIDFYDIDKRLEVMKLFVKDDYPIGYSPRFFLVVKDREGKPSIGDYLIAIIKTNNIITIEYTNSNGMKSSKYDDSKIINLSDLDRFGVKKGF